MKQIRIAITGPESTGKSTLAMDLAKHFNVSWVPEFARSYLNFLPEKYTYEDLLYIAKHQWSQMEQSSKVSTDSYLFCDTEMTVMRIWCEYKFGKCHEWIVDKQQHQDFDLYLLTDIDLPWQPDPLREHPDKREELMDLYKMALKKRNWPFEIVSGIGGIRTENAIKIIKKRC